MSAPEEDLEKTVGRKAERRERAQREGRHTVWFGFGMFGLVGWAVAVPTLAGVALGHWLDKLFPGMPSWTVMGLLAGVALGCLNAWWWVQRSGGHGDNGHGDGGPHNDGHHDDGPHNDGPHNDGPHNDGEDAR